MREHLLDSGWQLRERGPGPLEDDLAAGDWLPARAPGTVHEALLAAGRIPDPFYADNELKVQWVGERDWIYRCRFTPPAELLAEERLVLACESLDTFAEVRLNGAELLRSDNMFVSAEADVRGRLRPGDNELVIVFSSAARIAKEREARGAAMRVWNGDASRVYARKAQYHWGWDWGPCLITAGPAGPVRLLGYSARLRRIACPVSPSSPSSIAAGGRVEVRVTVEAEGAAQRARLRLLDPAGRLVAEAEAPLAGGRAEAALAVERPELWWPLGHGAQPLYRLEATLLRGADALDARALRLGLRTIELAQEPLRDGSGTSFHFVVNGRPIFCGGANWIPADSFTPRVEQARYERLLRLAREANVNMLRIWGGGIYEADRFYDLCDELGILVWQDFMFACGLYPADDWLAQSVRAEAAAQIDRLAHHACLALWCGNNEDYSIASSHAAFPPQRRGPQAPPFPARLLYEHVLPEVCAARDPSRPYWPGSPHGGGEDVEPNDPHSGDRHTWDVWHGLMADYQDYGLYTGRFVSEFGMQSLPSLAALRAVLPKEAQAPGSALLRFHNKAERGPERLQSYLDRNLPPAADLADEVYLSQLMQAEALGWALRSFRRGFGGPGDRRTSGALIWQWDDCWPVVSWAVVDYETRPKAGYHVVRRELAPVALGLAPPEKGASGAAVWAVTSEAREIEAELELRSFTPGGALVASERRQVRLLANQATELGAWSPDRAGERLIHGARLLLGGAALARAVLWPEPLRGVPLEDPGLEVLPQGGERLRLRAARPAKGVLLEAEGVDFSDNALDLLPGEEIVVHAPGLGDRAPQVRWLRTGAAPGTPAAPQAPGGVTGGAKDEAP